MKSTPRLVGIIVLSLLAAIAAFGGGLWYANLHQQRALARGAALRDPSPQKRLQALSAAKSGTNVLPPPLLVARIRDVNPFVSARAAETVYRLGYASHLTSETILAIDKQLAQGVELTQRWLLAVVIAYDFEQGFARAVQALPSMTSPWSRPFLVQILGLHGSASPAAQAVLVKQAALAGPTATLATEVLAWMKRPATKRFTEFFPTSLVVEQAPHRQAGSSGRSAED